MIKFFPLNQCPSSRQHLCHEAVTQDRLSPPRLLLPEMCLWCLQCSGAAGTSGKEQEKLNPGAPAGEEPVLVVPSSFIVTAGSRGSGRLKHRPHQCCPTDSAMAEAGAARGMQGQGQGQAQSLAAAAPTPHLPRAVLQLKAVPGCQLCLQPSRAGSPGQPGPSPAPAPAPTPASGASLLHHTCGARRGGEARPRWEGPRSC